MRASTRIYGVARSDKGLDVLYSTPARFVSRAPCISGHLRALASRSGEKCGLVKLWIGEESGAETVAHRTGMPGKSSHDPDEENIYKSYKKRAISSLPAVARG